MLLNDDANDAAGPKIAVAQDGRLDDYPVLLPEGGVTLTRVVMEKSTWPSERLGNVQIQRMTSLTVQTALVPVAGQFTMKLLICDGGESIRYGMVAIGSVSKIAEVIPIENRPDRINICIKINISVNW